MKTSETLKGLIRRSDLPITRIADLAQVDRHALARWMAGEQQSIKLDHAERVYRVLTGRGFLTKANAEG